MLSLFFAALLFMEDIGSGDPIIVVHGGPGLSSEYFRPGLDALSEKRQVIYYDQRGGGRSGFDEPIDLATFVADLDEVRKVYGHEKVTLLGHSWGAYVALNYALEHPEHVKGLILVGAMPVCSGDFKVFEQEVGKRAAGVDLPPSDGSEEALTAWVEAVCKTYFADPEGKELHCPYTPNGALVNSRFEKEFFPSYDLRPRLSEIQCPVLIIHGEKDPIAVSMIEDLHIALSNSTLYILPCSGHFPWIEQKEAFFSLIDDALD